MENQYDKIAKEYAKAQAEFFETKENTATTFIRSQLPKLQGLKILDIGCGAGKDIITYQKMGAMAYGIDESAEMIKEAKKSNHQGLLIHSSIEDMSFPNGFFDIVTARYVLHYIRDLDRAYEKIHGVLKPNGLLVAVVHHPMLSFMQLGGRDYQTKDEAEIALYDAKVKIHFPHHTLNGFFSQEFFKRFTLENMVEEPIEKVEMPNQWNIPGFIGFKARKK